MCNRQTVSVNLYEACYPSTIDSLKRLGNGEQTEKFIMLWTARGGCVVTVDEQNRSEHVLYVSTYWTVECLRGPRVDKRS